MVDTFPSVTIGSGDKAQTIIGALKPEEAAKRADTIMQSVKDLCNENKEQYRLSLWLLTQSSPLMMMIVAGSKYIGPNQLDEHTPLNYAFTKSENGDITVSMKLPEGRGYKAEATHVLHPDGTAETTNFVFESE